MIPTVDQEVRLVKKPGRKRGRYKVEKLEEDKYGTLITVWGPLRCNGHSGYHYVRECDIILPRSRGRL